MQKGNAKAKKPEKFLYLVLLTSYSIAWQVESSQRILTRLEIDIESSHEIDIKYSSRVTTLISSTRASQKVGMKTRLDDQSNEDIFRIKM